MDQVKEYLRLAVKYRFWIVVGVAALLPMIGYYATAGSLIDETKKKADEIKGAETGVKEFQSGVVPNAPFTDEVTKKKAVVETDVNASWRKLYERQAPLLKWPEVVAEKFQEWGRKWPEKVAPNVIRDTTEYYIRSYPKEVTAVYKSFNPWDPESGEGIVAAPPEDILLRPAPFDPDKLPLPSLGKIWAAQERLWIQGTVFDVVRKVNEKAKAKDWDAAPLKQINAIDVASLGAQDQRSKAEGKAPEPAPDIEDPSKPAEEKAEGAASSTTAGMPSGPGGMGGMGMGRPGAGAAAASEDVFYLPSPNKDQYNVVPIYLSVLIDQAHIPDLIVEFQNSPMAIQVLEIEMLRPSARLKKPVKGESQSFGEGGMMGGRGMMGMMGMSSDRILGGGRGGMQGMGMGADSMKAMMGPGMAGGMAGGGNQQRMMMGGRGAGAGGGRVSAVPEKKGVLVQKNADRGKAKKDKEKDAEKKEDDSPKLSDPYFNYVELHIYGQARFYNSPPPVEKAETPTESVTADEPAAAAKAEETPKDEAAPAGDPKAADDASKKDEAPKADKKDETPKAEPASKDEAAPKEDATPKAADEPKAGDAGKPKDEPKAKDEAPKR